MNKKAFYIISLLILLGMAILLSNNSNWLTQINDNVIFKFNSSTIFHKQKETHEEGSIFGVKNKPLISSRFRNLSQLQDIVTIRYQKDYSKLDSIECLNSVVHLSYRSNGDLINRSMCAGVSQDVVLEIKNSGFINRIQFILANLSLVRQRKELEKTYILSRRRPFIFGPNDVAFYDLALNCLYHINTPTLAFKNIRDSSDKGYINTFNHITAQAIITSIYSEDLADFIGDLHERSNMPEITSGRFTEKQLGDSINSPEDNYIDIINNEIGQKIGLQLKKKYKLSKNTLITPILLAAFLNDIQSYYMWSLEIGLDIFRPTDDVVIKFANKFNSL